jgi:hypothetical protein
VSGQKVVKDFVRDVRFKLENEGVVRLINVGTLHIDQQSKLLFDPDDSVNYLDDAFGLTSFISPAIIRKTRGKDLEKRFIDRKPVPVRDKRRKRALAAVLIIIPVLFITGWMLLQSDFLPDNTQKSSIVPLEEQEPKNREDLGFSEEIVIPPLKTLDFTEDRTRNTEEATNSGISEPQESVEDEYLIIGGAFGIEDNADKLVGILRQKGYDAGRAGLSKSGLHMVSYLSTEDKDEALINLAIIRKEDNPSAWLLKR